MPLPDAEHLCRDLIGQIRSQVRPDTALVGIHTGGVWLARRIHAALGMDIPLGTIDPAFYRDDIHRSGLHSQVRPSEIPFDVADRPIVIVDDILYTGRTIRAAMNELFDYGRPARIDLAVLIDRGGRELPICPRYCACVMDVPPDRNLQLEQDSTGMLSLRMIDA